jgi:hypothetical protein
MNPADDFLHIHIIDGELYVFTDNGHWQHSWPDESASMGAKAAWDASERVTLRDLENECCLGPINQEDRRIRIPLRSSRFHRHIGKFGRPYFVVEDL